MIRAARTNPYYIGKCFSQCALRIRFSDGNPPFLRGLGRRIYAGLLSFCAGVIPPLPMFLALIIIRPKPIGGNLLHLVDGFEDLEVQPFVPDRPVVALDISVLLWFHGCTWAKAMPLFSAHSMRVLLIYSGPLLTRMVLGAPRHSMNWFSALTTRSAGSEKSTSIPSPSRLKSSRTFSSRTWRLSPRDLP